MTRLLEKYGKFILALLGIVVIAIVVAAVAAEISERNKDEALLQLEELETEIEDSDTAFSLETLATRTAEIAKISNHRYIQNQIQFITARVYWDNDDYLEAADLYLQLMESAPESHFGQISFLNAAVAYEQHGDRARAVEILEQALVEYEFAVNPLLPRVLLNLGRLYEMDGDTARAAERYTALIDNYSGNELINLAYDRLIIIENSE